MATADELREAFATAWRATAGQSVTQTVGAKLVALCGDAARSHPTLEIDDRELTAAIASHAPVTELDAYLERCRAPELALARAAGRGVPSAIAELERANRATIEAVCRRFTGPAHSIDDLRQILRTKLFVAAPGKQPKIFDYAGQGFFDNWLRITAVRVFLDLAKRKDRAREAVAEDEDVLRLPQPGDLALDVVKAEYRVAVASAMHDAAQRLEAGDRHLLRQSLVVNLSIDQLGAVLGIHRATAARRIARAREHLVTETRRLLAERLAIDASELDEVIGLVMSRLDISLGKLLATSGQAG